MRAAKRLAPVLPALILMMPAPRAEDAVGLAKRDRPKSPPMCCNPAATNQIMKPPRGLYVGMPLQPGDLGYKRESKH